MDCEQFNQVLPEIIDGQVRDFSREDRIGVLDGQQNEYEQHLRACPECAELMADLQMISIQAQSLHGEEEPSPRVWNRIEIALRQEGLIHETPQPEIVFSKVPRRWRIPHFVPIAIAALIVLSAVGYKRLSAPPQAGDKVAVVATPAVKNEQAATAKAKVFRARNAVKSDQDFLALVAARRPNMRAKYEQDLQRVNAYIQDAENSVEMDPNDQLAQQDLMDAYQQKEVMYQLALDRSLP